MISSTPSSLPLISLWRALWSLTHPRILWHVLWPILAGVAVWTLLIMSGWWWLGPIIEPSLQEGIAYLPNWLVNLGLATLFMVVVHIVLAFLLLPLISMTFVVLLSLISMPLILPILAREHYPKLVQLDEIPITVSITHTLRSSLLFIVLYLGSYLIFFIPGAILFAHWLAIAFLNKQTFSFDALSLHAHRDEINTILEKKGRPLLLIGGLVSLLSYAPLINIFAPAIAGLWFAHYGLATLSALREQHPDGELQPLLTHHS